jgi:hypothetical protein
MKAIALGGALLATLLAAAPSSPAATTAGAGAIPYKLVVSGNGLQESTDTSTGTYDSGGNPTPCTKSTTLQMRWTLDDVWNDPAAMGQGPAWNFYVPTPALDIAIQNDDAGSFTETVTQSGTCPAESNGGTGCGTRTWPYGVAFELPLSSSSQLKAFADPSPPGGEECKYADDDATTNTYESAPAAGTSSNLLRWCNSSVTECAFPETPESIMIHGGSTSSDTWQLSIKACKSSPQTSLTGDRGWEGLSGEFQQRLEHMVELLEDQDACVQFTSGYRSYVNQKRLYQEWHDIADKHNSGSETPEEICEELAAAKLAQPPSSKKMHYPAKSPTHHCDQWSGEMEYEADGKAKGGPAKPGHSRHEVGEAADFNVLFPPDWTPDVTRYRKASHDAKLCGPTTGPTTSDQVHVEMPYKTAGETEPSCHFD